MIATPAQIAACESLTELRDLLNAATPEDLDNPDAPEIDMSSLPTFGGEEPADTSDVWSWDERNVLTSSYGGRPYKTEPRVEADETLTLRNLIDSDTGERLGYATAAQAEASDSAGDEGHIRIDEDGDIVESGGRRVYVEAE